MGGDRRSVTTQSFLLSAVLLSSWSSSSDGRQLSAGASWLSRRLKSLPYPDDPPAWCMGTSSGRENDWDDGKCQRHCVDNESGSCPEHDCRCNLNTYGNPIRRSFASSSETRQCFAVDIDMYSNHLHVSLNSSMEGAVVRARSALDHKARRPSGGQHDMSVSSGGFVRLDREAWETVGSIMDSEDWPFGDTSDSPSSGSESEERDWAGRWTFCLDTPESGERVDVSLSITATTCPMSPTSEICYGRGSCQEDWFFCSGKDFFSMLCQKSVCQCDCGWSGSDCSLPEPCHSPPPPFSPPSSPLAPMPPPAPFHPPPLPPTPPSSPPPPPAVPVSPPSPSPSSPSMPPQPSSPAPPPPVQLIMPSSNGTTRGIPANGAEPSQRERDEVGVVPELPWGESRKDANDAVTADAPSHGNDGGVMREGVGEELGVEALTERWRDVREWVVIGVLSVVTVVFLVGIAVVAGRSRAARVGKDGDGSAGAGRASAHV